MEPGQCLGLDLLPEPPIVSSPGNGWMLVFVPVSLERILVSLNYPQVCAQYCPKVYARMCHYQSFRKIFAVTNALVCYCFVVNCVRCLFFTSKKVFGIFWYKERPSPEVNAEPILVEEPLDHV